MAAILPGFHTAPTGRPNPPLPRNIGRRAWLAYQRALRDAADRDGSGLPQHPANAYIACPDCDGAGCHTRNDTNPHGFGPDPQCDYDVRCERCGGSGDLIDGYVDLLAQMRRHRLARRRGVNGWLYESARRRATIKCAGLAQADMLARAAACVNEVERGVAAMRRAVAA